MRGHSAIAGDILDQVLRGNIAVHFGKLAAVHYEV